LEERTNTAKTDYDAAVKAARDKFKDMFTISAPSGGNPFTADVVNIKGVKVDFGTTRFQSFLSIIPALIILMATIAAAFIILGGSRKGD
jgi:hypothetical protein